MRLLKSVTPLESAELIILTRNIQIFRRIKIYCVHQKGCSARANPKQNKRDEIIKGVQDSYAMSGEPVDAKETVANAKDEAD